MIPMLLKSWRHLQHPDPGVMEIHLMPLADIDSHAFDEDCRCGAYEDPAAPGFVIHFAFDGRDRYESGQRKVH